MEDLGNPSGDNCLANPPESILDTPSSRRSALGGVALWSLGRRLPLISAGLFTALAAWGAKTAEAHPGQGNYSCCNLARGDQWCAPLSGGIDFWCDHGGFKRVWYCCAGNHTVGCGECVGTTGSCFSGPWYCSYGWLINGAC